jgi:LmbE family N-acetylglucosaminyl deacetylase
MFKNSLRHLAMRAMKIALRVSSSPFHLTAERVLIVAPHPDDETLGCGGLIAGMSRAGKRVDVVFLTDGAASHSGHPKLAPLDLARLRRAESLAALSVLGVDGARVCFLDLPDGALDRLPSETAAAARDRLIGLLRDLRPDGVFAPFGAEPSAEHAAALELVSGAMASTGGGRLLQYPVWAWWNPVCLLSRLGRRNENLRLVLGETRSLKLRALACHRTQVESIPPWKEPVLPKAIKAGCCGAEEFFFTAIVPAAASPGRSRQGAIQGNAG